MFLIYQGGGGDVSYSSIANDSLVVFQQTERLCDVSSPRIRITLLRYVDISSQLSRAILFECN